KLLAIEAVFGVGLVVVADFADGDDAFLREEQRQNFHDLFGEWNGVRLFAVQPDRAVMADAELSGPKPLVPDQRQEIVEKRADGRPRLPHPERRLNHRNNPSSGHRLIIVGGTTDGVNVRVDVVHVTFSGTARTKPSDTPSPLQPTATRQGWA